MEKLVPIQKYLSYLNSELYILVALALFLTFVTVWFVAIFALKKSNIMLKVYRSVVPEYEPPEGIGPILANYIMKSGAQGGTAGSVSISGSQILSMISLHERGLLSDLLFNKENNDIFFKINSDFQNMIATKEEKILANLILNKIGKEGVLHEDFSKKNSDGYKELNQIWFEYWYSDVHQVCKDSGLVLQSNSFSVKIIRYVGLSMTFGLFFGIFFAMIPFIGWVISLVLLSPVVAIGLVWFLFLKLLFIILPIAIVNYFKIFTGLVINPISFFAMFISWFGLFMLFGKSLPVLNNPLSENGKEIRRRLLGYKMFLKSVDKDRLTIEYVNKANVKREVTTFSWLVVFELAGDNHWEQWYERHKGKMMVNSLL